MEGTREKYSFQFEEAETKKKKPDKIQDVMFGSVFTDHMFIMDYDEERHWHDGRTVPYGPIALQPATAVFHYAQGLYEGLKAYRSSDGRILLFREMMNAKRLNTTAQRMHIPKIDEELFVSAVRTLIDIERDWVPGEPGTSLYIRPFIIATGEYLGLKPSSEYRFAIILSPVSSYHKKGLNPTSVYIESEMSRSAAGGTGGVKCIGNYAPTLLAESIAKENGCDQVLWLDGAKHKYIEEMGAANIFFVLNDEVLTPSLEKGTILPGITRDSVIHILRDLGIRVREKSIPVEEIYKAHEKGELKESFTTGTAAVVSPVGEFLWKGKKIVISNKKTGPITKQLYDTLTGIQFGRLEDKYGWVSEV